MTAFGRVCLVTGACATTLALAAAPAPAGTYAPVDNPGPPLRTPKGEMERATVCEGDFRGGSRAVLLVPGTAFDYDSQYSWSWAPALTRAGIPWCAVSPPESQLGDLTIAGEYDAYAIRKTYRLAGRRPIAVVGHSQGGMQPR